MTIRLVHSHSVRSISYCVSFLYATVSNFMHIHYYTTGTTNNNIETVGNSE